MAKRPVVHAPTGSAARQFSDGATQQLKQRIAAGILMCHRRDYSLLTPYRAKTTDARASAVKKKGATRDESDVDDPDDCALAPMRPAVSASSDVELREREREETEKGEQTRLRRHNCICPLQKKITYPVVNS